MVEKWLLQVENTMLMSIRAVIKQGMEQYSEVQYKQTLTLIKTWNGISTLCLILHVSDAKEEMGAAVAWSGCNLCVLYLLDK